jgi:hypothetical protein
LKGKKKMENVNNLEKEKDYYITHFNIMGGETGDSRFFNQADYVGNCKSIEALNRVVDFAEKYLMKSTRARRRN